MKGYVDALSIVLLLNIFLAHAPTTFAACWSCSSHSLKFIRSFFVLLFRLLPVTYLSWTFTELASKVFFFYPHPLECCHSAELPLCCSSTVALFTSGSIWLNRSRLARQQRRSPQKRGGGRTEEWRELGPDNREGFRNLSSISEVADGQ